MEEDMSLFYDEQQAKKAYRAEVRALKKIWNADARQAWANEQRRLRRAAKKERK